MKLETKKGVSILLAVFLLSFVLSIALGTSIVLIRQVKTMRSIGFSVIAFYAADNGIEEVLAMDTLSEGNIIPETQLSNEAKYSVFVNASTTEGCDAANYCIKSIGIYRNTRRAIEVIF